MGKSEHRIWVDSKCGYGGGRVNNSKQTNVKIIMMLGMEKNIVDFLAQGLKKIYVIREDSSLFVNLCLSNPCLHFTLRVFPFFFFFVVVKLLLFSYQLFI